MDDLMDSRMAYAGYASYGDSEYDDYGYQEGYDYWYQLWYNNGTRLYVRLLQQDKRGTDPIIGSVPLLFVLRAICDLFHDVV